MKKIIGTRIFTILVSSFSMIQAQDFECEGYLDHRPKDVAKLGVSGTAHFSAKKFRIIPKLFVASSYSDYTEKAMQSLVDNYKTNSGDWGQATQFVGQITQTSGMAASAITAMFWTGFSLLVGNLQSLNVGHRDYAFFVPVAGRYHIQARLTGDWDKPRNRVIVFGPEGQAQLDDDNPSSNVTKHYWTYLAAGPHSISVQIGSGVSAVFHNAGTLEIVELDAQNPLQWEAPVLVGYSQPLVTQLMPLPGDTATVTINYTVPNRSSFPNLLDGDVVVDSLKIQPNPIQPHFYATWRSDHLYWLCVTQSTLAYTSEPRLNTIAKTANFFLQRGGDVMDQVVVKGPLYKLTLSE